VTDLPLIKAAKLWAKVSQRTGATYVTGRWGGCRVLVFENLERTSDAEPSHFLFLGEAGAGAAGATGHSCRRGRGRGGGEARPATSEGAREGGGPAAAEGPQAT
jgi:hypothetical protein